MGALILSLLLKLPQRKLEPWLVLWNFFLLSFLFFSINQPYGLAWYNPAEVFSAGITLADRFLNKNPGLLVSSKLGWASYIAKIASKKIGTLIVTMNFLSSEVVLYLSNPNIGSSTWSTLVMPGLVLPAATWICWLSCYLDMLDMLLKPVSKTIGMTLATTLEPLVHCCNVASLNLFYSYYFGR